MDQEALQNFFQFVQKACLPGVWSKGVAMARDNQVSIDKISGDEIILRVKSSERAVSPKVSLWPADEDYFCDCGDRADPCAHVAGAVVALKGGLKPEAVAVASSPSIQYRFIRSGNGLALERWIGNEKLMGTLVSYVGGINAGRIPGKTVAATKDDFAVDYALGDLRKLLSALKGVAGVTLDSQPIQVGPPTRGLHVEIRDDGPGVRLIAVEEATIDEVFENGIVRQGGVLRLLEDPGLSSEERKLLESSGKWFGANEYGKLISEIIPSLEKKLSVRVITRKLPEISPEILNAPPKLILRTEREGHDLVVAPAIVYSSEFSARDPEAEKLLARRLQAELHIAPGQRSVYRGAEAIEFIKKAQSWEIEGIAARSFVPEASLKVGFTGRLDGFDVSFQTESGKTADPAALFRAWRENESFVPLLGGGFAPLPEGWLSRFGERIEKLIAAREANSGKVPAYLRPEIIQVTAESGGKLDDALSRLRARIEDFEKIPEAPLPPDLKADLRHYQRQGVNWLSFLRDSGMGALLADDMGLGKTLQAMCALQGRALVVTPTSVLHSWSDQIRKFRPELKISLYHGPARQLDPEADVTLTTYGILRQDRDRLTAIEWGTAVLDEAQIIKNPESQSTQAAHQIKASFRMTLSGTPVENSLDDLWSQFQFLNPGLLGERADFQDEFSRDIPRLRARIKPFILRRLKKDVAPELPPKTEVVLESELSSEERELYDSLLASGRNEVIQLLEQGGSIFGALELLLRLRQAVCHPALVPGQRAATSSKLELLMQTLSNSMAQGHRALVFSQWTSFLDLIEARFKQDGIGYLRLDGSTPDRRKVVEDFQDPAGPPVILISLKAGGVGLTLTAADHVFLMDSWWNPAVEDQAADRVHRIGQENPVLVCRLIARDTLEERILELQKRKQALSGAVLEGSSGAASLTREDLMTLLN